MSAPITCSSPPPHDRGQPILFEPGTQTDVFEVTFDEEDTIKWILKAPGDSRHQVEASADSERCPPPTRGPFGMRVYAMHGICTFISSTGLC